MKIDMPIEATEDCPFHSVSTSTTGVSEDHCGYKHWKRNHGSDHVSCQCFGLDSNFCPVSEVSQLDFSVRRRRLQCAHIRDYATCQAQRAQAAFFGVQTSVPCDRVKDEDYADCPDYKEDGPARKGVRCA